MTVVAETLDATLKLRPYLFESLPTEYPPVRFIPLHVVKINAYFSFCNQLHLPFFVNNSNIIRPIMGDNIYYLDYSASHFFSDIDQLRPVFRRLYTWQIHYLGELVQRSREDIALLGKATDEQMVLLTEELHSIGLDFSMDVRGWTAEPRTARGR